MWFRLAEQCGCTVAELQDRMDSREFTEWGIWRRINPWDSEKVIHMIARVCSILTSSKKKFHKPSGFIPNWSGRRDRSDFQSVKQIQNTLGLMAGGNPRW